MESEETKKPLFQQEISGKKTTKIKSTSQSLLKNKWLWIGIIIFIIVIIIIILLAIFL
ncbi:MAG: hypothetical protein QW478_01015 [Candidatus Micrarchaeaceae archaeon]